MRRWLHRGSLLVTLSIVALCADPIRLGGAVRAQDSASVPILLARARFATVSLGAAHRDGENGGVIALAFGWRWRRVLTTVTPMEVLVVPDWSDDIDLVPTGNGLECRYRNSGGQARCPTRVAGGAALEMGYLLRGESAVTWLGVGWRTGGGGASYAGVTLIFPRRLPVGDSNASHFQMQFRAGRHLAQATLGVAATF